MSIQGDLVLRAQRGDREAFGALVHGVIARLHATARLILHDSDVAQDALQDSLVEAWRDIRGLRDPERLDAWLHRLLVRSCYRAADRTRGRAVIEIPLLDDHDRPTPDGLDRVGLRDEIERALARLRTDHRAALVLVYFADLSLADAALALGIPVGTMKSRLNRAIDALRAAIAADARLEFTDTERSA